MFTMQIYSICNKKLVNLFIEKNRNNYNSHSFLIFDSKYYDDKESAYRVYVLAFIGFYSQ